jgi:hypothetical protein
MDEIELENYRGDSFQMDILVEDEDGNPEDFTGATFRMAIGTTILETTSGVTITDNDAGGTVFVFINYTVMSTLAVGTYDIDVEATWTATGRRETILKGVLEIIEDVRQ